MDNIKKIFYGESQEVEPIIKHVQIDWKAHSIGIQRIANDLVPDFEIHEHIKPILKSLLLYFTGDKKSTLDLNKGIMLVGGVGTGKTLLSNIFKAYTMEIIQINSYRWYTSQEIIDSVNTEGAKYLDKFGIIADKPITCYIDDIASSNEIVMHYGTKTNVMEQLLSMRYNVYERFKKLTHVSTNMYPTELIELYGDRVVDRMKMMFNIIELKGTSRRH